MSRFVRPGIILAFVVSLGGGCGPANPPAWDKPFPGVIQDSQSIKGFVGDYSWLSNFYPAPVTYEGLHYLSSEAAYQAAKLPPAQRQAFTSLDPDAAKHLARSSTFDPAAWDARKDRVMREVLLAKFSQHEDLRKRLLETGSRYLEETNWWNDPYWGVYEGKGENRLGHLLMDLRAQLAASTLPK